MKVEVSKVTPEYAKLSLLAGFFAARADEYLGGDYFIGMVRSQAWNLTEDLLVEWKKEAMAKGVPEEDLDPDLNDSLLADFIAQGLKIQAAVDEAVAKSREKK